MTLRSKILEISIGDMANLGVLTYMLTQLVERLEANRELKLWRPLDQQQSIRRCLYLTPAASAQVHQFVGSAGAVRAAGLAQDLSRFAMGRLLRAQDHVKRLKPPSREIWELRSQLPKPAFRLLGAFLARDEFVVLQAAARADYDGGRWSEAIRHTEAEWKRLFGSAPRHSGVILSDYLTNTDPDGSGPVP